MLQAVMTQPGKIEFKEIERPRAAAGEVLIEVKRIGVCGSDIHVYNGLHPYTGYPVVGGGGGWGGGGGVGDNLRGV
jgi:L-iditol 2-dehydrogenase